MGLALDAVRPPRTSRGGREALIITELPYQVNKASLIEKISELSREKKIDGIAEIRDETNREGIRVVLELGRGDLPQIVLNQLYKHTQMQTTFGIIMLAIVDRRPQVVDLKQMLEAFVQFRREIVTRRTRYELARAEERAHVLGGRAPDGDLLEIGALEALLHGLHHPVGAERHDVHAAAVGEPRVVEVRAPVGARHALGRPAHLRLDLGDGGLARDEPAPRRGAAGNERREHRGRVRRDFSGHSFQRTRRCEWHVVADRLVLHEGWCVRVR